MESIILLTTCVTAMAAVFLGIFISNKVMRSKRTLPDHRTQHRILAQEHFSKGNKGLRHSRLCRNIVKFTGTVEWGEQRQLSGKQYYVINTFFVTDSGQKYMTTNYSDIDFSCVTVTGKNIKHLSRGSRGSFVIIELTPDNKTTWQSAFALVECTMYSN